MKRIYYYVDETETAEYVFSEPLTKEELIANGYLFLRSEKMDHHQEG